MNTYKRAVVTHLFNLGIELNKVDITDPGYDSGTFGRIDNVKVVPGPYTCIAWKDGEKVAGIGIYRNNRVPNISYMKELGVVGVDSGLAGFFASPKRDYPQDEWEALVKRLYEDPRKTVYFTENGFFAQTKNGDGIYPVLARIRKDGLATALEIWF